MSELVSDDLLYRYVPMAESAMLDKLPAEGDMHHAFSRRFNRRMKALLKYERRSPRTRVFYRHLKTAAAMLLVVLTLSFGTVMSVEAYRVRFFNIVMEVWEELTSIVVSSDENADLDKLIPISPTYIPDGYKVAESNSNQY